jgi:hypothetical protein
MADEKMIKKFTRQYVYDDIFNEIMEWGKRQNFRTPNNRGNFPFYLEQYINHLKWIGKNGKP